MRIRVNKGKCSGCRLCEMVCSLFHLGSINIEKSAIRIQKDDLDTGLNRPLVCRQCRDMKCLEGEKVDNGSEKGRFVWDGVRAGRCPFGALGVFAGSAYHCDLCGGRPRCVRVCTPGAIGL
jgi:carbon-monoxide dehydrogenase iron sulfur subunit